MCWECEIKILTSIDKLISLKSWTSLCKQLRYLWLTMNTASRYFSGLHTYPLTYICENIYISMHFQQEPVELTYTYNGKISNLKLFNKILYARQRYFFPLDCKILLEVCLKLGWVIGVWLREIFADLSHILPCDRLYIRVCTSYMHFGMIFVYTFLIIHYMIRVRNGIIRHQKNFLCVVNYIYSVSVGGNA